MTAYTRHMKQSITYWVKTGQNKYNKPTFASPVTVNGRWEEKSESIRAKDGKETISKARVYLPLEVLVDSYVYLGTSVATDPTSVAGAWEVQAGGKIPDMRNLRTLYMVYL